MERAWVCVDGNDAVADVAYRLSEVVAIYPITPASAMGEAADAWRTKGRANLWGFVPEVIEMQSEAGAAGALHGAVQRGSLGVTFTASQGLLLMLPNMFKIAGELTPAVIHVAARAVATHALSIFGDHSDVMASRSTGWVMLASSSVQEAQDLALVAHAATLRCRLPFLHFFDGFRTSHEVAKIRPLDDDTVRALIDDEAVLAHRLRGLDPDRPVLRGSAQNPDVFFQAREAASPFYAAVPTIVQGVMDEFAALTGRAYHLVDYHGAPDATRVIVIMGSGTGAARQAVDKLNASGQKTGVVTIRLFRPFPTEAFVATLPRSVREITVLDRTKEPGAIGEPLYQDVITALAESDRPMPRVIGGRYGLASKEFTPAMAKAVLDEHDQGSPRRHITVGITDDVSHSSVKLDPSFRVDDGARGALLYGLGSDGTVGASKQAVKIVGEKTDLFAQGYFVHDSKKSGSLTVSHVRFGERPIDSTYLVDRASLVACSQFGFVDRIDLLEHAADGATLLLNSPYPADEVWDRLPLELQQSILDKHVELWVVDATMTARTVGLGGRTSSVMLPCFLALAGILPRDRMLAAVEASLADEYGKRGAEVVQRNRAAIHAALVNLHRVDVPATVSATHERGRLSLEGAGAFVAGVTARLVAGEGERLPVSAFPPDGTFPTGTARYEKRSIALELPEWDPDLCIDCGKCTIVCPHAAIRMKIFEPSVIDDAPAGFLDKPFRSKDVEGYRLTIQVAPDDCTGCGVCVDVCPAHSKTDAAHRALDMKPASARADIERPLWEYFTEIPEVDRSLLPHDSVKGSQVLQPLFEFSGACAGCGETPYLKLLTQLFGDRMLVANATGCSSIYGGNLPTTPWAANHDGRGPAWSNSLFEDNAEFGLGMRLAADHQRAEACALVARLRDAIGEPLATEIIEAAELDSPDEADINAQRERVSSLIERIASVDSPDAKRLRSIATALVRRSVWVIGGDGWAYDIGSGGLDHLLASGRNVNILVLDTEVYSNTGGQASKATPRGAVAKFATSGKSTPKKDLGLIAASYGSVYVAQVALGANDVQTTKAFVEAEAWDGPSLIIAYATCIAHGIDMKTSMSHQKAAVKSGYWPLFRFHPGAEEHQHPFRLDSKPPSIPVKEFALDEARFSVLAERDREHADHLLALTQSDVDERWRHYEQLARVERTSPAPGDEE